MRVNGYQCDACCKTNSGEESLKNWFALYDFRKGVESDEQHFCSLHCLHEWVEKQMPVVEEKIEYVDPHGGSLFGDGRKDISGSQFDNEYMGKFVDGSGKEEDPEYWRSL